MRRAAIVRKFAELERFVDTPVKHYSSGMYLRLAFAVAAHHDRHHARAPAQSRRSGRNDAERSDRHHRRGDPRRPNASPAPLTEYSRNFVSPLALDWR